jgi:hypothetical protein
MSVVRIISRIFFLAAGVVLGSAGSSFEVKA